MLTYKMKSLQLVAGLALALISTTGSAFTNDYQKKVIKEIISTEISYFEGLSNLKLFFIDPILESKLIKNSEITSKIKTLSGYIEQAKVLSKLMVEDLTKNKDNLNEIAGVFIDLSPGFGILAPFVRDYSSLSSFMESKVFKDNKKVQEIVLNLSKKTGGKKIGDFMITPVQRVPRYVMLLDVLFKQDPTTGKLPAKQEEALRATKAAGEYINNFGR